MSQHAVQQVDATKNLPHLLGRSFCASSETTVKAPSLNNSAHGSYKTCPLCLEDLVKNGLEVGALTFKGDRIEEELYHVGCVTMMLAHRGAIKYNKNNRPSIAWGTSPVSRQAVDGFLQVPSLENKQRWIKFVDWRHKGEICVAELASLAAATLPIDEDSITGFVETTLGVSRSGSVTIAQLESDIIPYVDRTMQESGHKTIDIYDNGCPAREASACLSVVSQQSCQNDSDDADDSDDSGVKCTFCMPFRRRKWKM